MPSSKKRVTVYLDDREAEAVARLAEVTHESRSSVIAGIVTAALPMLDRVADLAVSIKSAPDEIRATFVGVAEQLDGRFTGLVNESEALWAAFEAAAGGEAPA